MDALLLSGSLGLLLFLWPFSVGMSIYANFNGIWFWMMVGLLIGMFVGILSGYLPAYKASKLDPIESLRFE